MIVGYLDKCNKNISLQERGALIIDYVQKEKLKRTVFVWRDGLNQSYPEKE